MEVFSFGSLVNKGYFWYFFSLCLLGYFLGLFVEVMEIDAAQYAAISMEMVEKNSFLKVFIRNENYLDKPPLTFWLAALSFKCFGIHTWSYKLPSLLFALISIYYTYKFCLLFYNKRIADWACLVLASCQGMYLMTQDCRTDTLLTGSVMMAIYHLAYFVENEKSKSWIWGFVGVGLAMLAKGPIGLVAPVMALAADVLIKKNWKVIFRWQWFAGLGIVALLLLPMSIGLYQQHGKEGLLFYYWKQSFGRITGDNDFVKQLDTQDYVNDPFFFYHTFLWAFLPWAVISYFSFFKLLVNLFQKKRNQYPEWISWGAVIFTFLAMSMSQFKLPHYIFVCFPMVAVLTASYIVETIGNTEKKALIVFHWIVPPLFLFIIVYLVLVSFPANRVWDSVAILVGIALVLVLRNAKEAWERTLKTLFLMVTLGNLILNGMVYPRLLTYQWGSEIGKEIKKMNIQEKTTVFCYEHTFDLDFYAQKLLKHGDIGDEHWKNLRSGEYIILKKEELKYLEEQKCSYELIKEVPGYSVTLLTPEFLNPSTRETTLRPRSLIKIL